MLCFYLNIYLCVLSMGKVCLRPAVGHNQLIKNVFLTLFSFVLKGMYRLKRLTERPHPLYSDIREHHNKRTIFI